MAPGDGRTVEHGEPVLLLIRDEDGGELVVKETYTSPSLNAPDHLFALYRDYTPPYQRGTVVVAADGTPIGLASHAGRFYGQPVVWGGLSLRYLPAVLLDSAIHLLERPPSHLGITPAAVAYYGPDLTTTVDGPVTRELLAVPVQEALKDLEEPVPLESLSKRPGSTRPPELGTILELLYATPQELRGPDGELLGSARYIALWWDREGGAPDLILCGTDGGSHVGAAFATHGLSSFEALLEGAPSNSPHSMVAAERLRPSGYSSDNYQYPYEWELKTDKPAYSQDEIVMLTLTITNTSDWPVTLNFVPPTVYYRQHSGSPKCGCPALRQWTPRIATRRDRLFHHDLGPGAFRGGPGNSRALRCPCTPGQPRRQLAAKCGADRVWGDPRVMQ